MKYWRPIHFGLGYNYGNSLRLCQAPDQALEVAEFTFSSLETKRILLLLTLDNIKKTLSRIFC